MTKFKQIIGKFAMDAMLWLLVLMLAFATGHPVYVLAFFAAAGVSALRQGLSKAWKQDLAHESNS